MSYIYSQALVAEFLEANCSETDACVQLSESHTHKPSWWHDKTMEPSSHSRFGMTYAPLTEILGVELLTWFVADSLAKTSALPETGPDWTAKGQGYGQKWQGLLAKYNPDTHSLKTAQLSLLEDLTGCCPTLPRWGLMLDGELYPQPMLEPSTNGSASGFWQTPVADDAANRASGKWNSRGEPKLSAQVMLPTPTAMLGASDLNFQCSGDGRKKPNKLVWAVAEMYPTPTRDSATERTTRYAQGEMPLTMAVQAKTYPTATATATAYKGWSPNHNRASTDDRLDYTVERESFQPGQQTPPMRLNPDWVEWLMGWPIGHTALKPLETGRLAEWQQQHSLFYMNDKECA